MRNLFLALATALLASSAALADGTSTAAPAAQPAAGQATASNASPLICHYVTFQGMIIRRKVCKTKNEWDNERNSGKRDIERMQQGGYQQAH